jgi:hypothetical protein
MVCGNNSAIVFHLEEERRYFRVREIKQQGERII